MKPEDAKLLKQKRVKPPGIGDYPGYLRMKDGGSPHDLLANRGKAIDAAVNSTLTAPAVPPPLAPAPPVAPLAAPSTLPPAPVGAMDSAFMARNGMNPDGTQLAKPSLFKRAISAVGLKSGGEVSGMGGPTDDQVPAMLSDGEFVIPADVVKKFGKTYFEKMLATHHKPSGAKSTGNLNSPPMMADGGLLSGIDERKPKRVFPFGPDDFSAMAQVINNPASRATPAVPQAALSDISQIPRTAPMPIAAAAPQPAISDVSQIPLAAPVARPAQVAAAPQSIATPPVAAQPNYGPGVGDVVQNLPGAQKAIAGYGEAGKQWDNNKPANAVGQFIGTTLAAPVNAIVETGAQGIDLLKSALRPAMDISRGIMGQGPVSDAVAPAQPSAAPAQVPTPGKAPAAAPSYEGSYQKRISENAIAPAATVTKDLGNGIRRIDEKGKSPLFTNVADQTEFNASRGTVSTVGNDIPAMQRNVDALKELRKVKEGIADRGDADYYTTGYGSEAGKARLQNERMFEQIARAPMTAGQRAQAYAQLLGTVQQGQASNAQAGIAAFDSATRAKTADVSNEEARGRIDAGKLDLQSKKETAALVAKIKNEPDLAKRKQLEEMLLATMGKNPRESRAQIINEESVNDAGIATKTPYIYNPDDVSVRRAIPQAKDTPEMATQKAKAAVKNGASKDAVNKMLVAEGYKPI